MAGIIGLSKSLILKGMQCPKALYLQKNPPDFQFPPQPDLEAKFRAGNKVGTLAQQLFPGGTEVPFEGLSVSEQIAQTRQLNAVQLSRIGADVSQLLTLAKGTMVLSGLTLGVSAAGFLFLNHKLKKVDARLQEISKDVKKIREFLELQERARLTTALKTLRSIDESVDVGVREKLLVNAKQTLSEIHEKYRELLIGVNSVQEALPVEEYYTVTAMGHALCAAELDMYEHAYNDLKDAHEEWNSSVRRVSEECVLKGEPERFMYDRYVEHVKADELVDWMDFANNSDKGIEWIDDIRRKITWKPKMPTFSKKLDQDEQLQIELMRKVVARERVFDGYASQYKYFSQIKQRPSTVQQYIESLPKDSSVDECFVLLSDDLLEAA